MSEQTPPPPRIAYLTGVYPLASHTFIQREIASLRSLGSDVVITSIRCPEAKEIAEGIERPTSTTGGGGGFADGSFEQKLYGFIRSDVAPFLQADGGDIELVGYVEGTVQVRLQGACGTCPSSIATLRGGVERRLKEEFPEEVQQLELVPA